MGDENYKNLNEISELIMEREIDKDSVQKAIVQLLTAFGETKCIADWIDDERTTVCCADSLRNRLKRGMSPEDAITKPVTKGRKRR